MTLADDAWWRFGIRHRSKDRKHGDPFPLPRLSTAGLEQGDMAMHALRQRVDQAFRSLNDLASADFSPATTTLLPLTSAQAWIMEDVWRRVERHGEPPDLEPEEVLRDMSCKANLYSQEAAHLVPMDLSKIKILRRRLQVTPAVDLLPPHVAAYLEHCSELIEKSPDELSFEEKESDPIEPYWDPTMKRSFSKRMELYKALDKSQLLTFRRRRKGRIGFFTVRKKDDQQRLIVDARGPNAMHRKPPTTSLSTPAGFMELDFGTLTGGGCGDPLEVSAGFVMLVIAFTTSPSSPSVLGSAPMIECRWGT